MTVKLNQDQRLTGGAVFTAEAVSHGSRGFSESPDMVQKWLVRGK